MANEQDDEQYEGEDGEYHFSEDQINYEMEQPDLKPAPPTGTTASFLSKLTPARKAVLGAIVFIILLSVVFKMLLPTTVPTTEFSQTVTSNNKPVVAKQNPKKVSPPSQSVAAQTIGQPVPGMPAETTVSNPSMNLPQPGMATPGGPPQTSSVVVTNNNPAQPTAGPPSSPSMAEGPAQMQQQLTGPPSVAEGQQMQQPTGMVQSTLPSQQSLPMAGNVPPSPIDETKNIVNRVASLEQENAAVVNVLRTEYAQKLSDYEAQDTAMRNKLDELTKRINHMEASLSQIAQSLQTLQKAPMASNLIGPAVIATPAREMKSIFTVQAIIPGRAWLKSDAGETVTVAEGDMLRNYGRITKIDPYDGIVNIDTGNRVVTLSYGASAD